VVLKVPNTGSPHRDAKCEGMGGHGPAFLGERLRLLGKSLGMPPMKITPATGWVEIGLKKPTQSTAAGSSLKKHGIWPTSNALLKT